MKRILALGMLLIILTSATAALAENAAVPDASFTLAGLDTTQYRTWSDHAFFSAMDELMSPV